MATCRIKFSQVFFSIMSEEAKKEEIEETTDALENAEGEIREETTAIEETEITDDTDISEEVAEEVTEEVQPPVEDVPADEKIESGNVEMEEEQIAEEAEESTAVEDVAADVEVEGDESTAPVEDSVPVAETQTESDTSTDQSMLEAYDETLKHFEEGEIVTGTVVGIGREDVMVDIGYKSEGYIPISEFEIRRDGTPDVSPGDSIAVYLVHKEDREGRVVLSKEVADRRLLWEEIDRAFRENRSIEGKVTRKIKGGLEVAVGNMRAFLPASQIDVRPTPNLDKYIGKTVEVKVLNRDARKRNVVVSRRKLLEEELEARSKELLGSLEVGQLVRGTVKNLTQFGAFVDLGGVDGLLRTKEMSWKRINHPSEVVKKGDKIEAKVLEVKPEDGKVALSLKDKTPDPWFAVAEKYPPKSLVTGKVTNVMDYGAFVELEEGVEGLIHVSEMSWSRRQVRPSDIVSENDTVEVHVLEVNPKKKTIALSLKELQPNPWELLETKYPVGAVINGIVRGVTSYGAFVEIEEGIDGLVHYTDMSWAKKAVRPSDIVKEGDEVEAVVVKIDAEKQQVSLSFRVGLDPWLKVPEKYKLGSPVKGEIVKIIDIGAFAKLEDGVEGLIHISELAERRIESPEEIVSVGDVLDLKVISLDPVHRKIGLSLKEYLREQERASIQEYVEESEEEEQEQEEEVEEEPRHLTSIGALIQEAIRKKRQEDIDNDDEEG